MNKTTIQGFLLVATGLFLGLYSCSHIHLFSSNNRSSKNENITIIISMDGFRHDYINMQNTPQMFKLAQEGVKAEGLIPIFPSKTFPNHYSIVTGLYPIHHGIISNKMFDPVFNETFTLSNGASHDGKWYGGEPIWLTAEKQGVKTATYFWPGSDAQIQGIRPTYYKTYDGDITYAKRVSTILSWLDLPRDERPELIALYFESPDSEGHDNGPTSAKLDSALQLVDNQLADLLSSLEIKGLRDSVNIIITSDHGMTQLSRDRIIFLDDYIDLDDIKINYHTAFVEIFVEPENIDSIFNRLYEVNPNLRAYKKGYFPERFHYTDHRRVPSIFCLADLGWTVTTHSFFDQHPHSFTGGSHGYDPADQDMWGIFIANGPSFKEHKEIPPIENIHLYELICDILHITPAPNDGDPHVLQDIIQ